MTVYAHLRLTLLAHVLPLEACSHEVVPEPSDHAVRRAIRDSAKGQRSNERITISLEGIRDDSEAGQKERQQAQCLRATERSIDWRHWGLEWWSSEWTRQ